jgi:hypothetical protein
MTARNSASPKLESNAISDVKSLDPSRWGSKRERVDAASPEMNNMAPGPLVIAARNDRAMTAGPLRAK